MLGNLIRAVAKTQNERKYGFERRRMYNFPLKAAFQPIPTPITSLVSILNIFVDKNVQNGDVPQGFCPFIYKFLASFSHSNASSP